MKKTLKEYKEMFSEKRPQEWDAIPDIELYMDQVISYMQRQHLGLEINENLTSSMVNNYAKQNLIPRANGKKYDRTHIAWLTAICLLKQVVSVSDVKTLLDCQIQDEEISIFYEKYMNILDDELNKIDNLIDVKSDKNEVANLALSLAISSYVQKLACECLIDTLLEEED